MNQTPNNIELTNLKVQPKDVKLTIADPSPDEANPGYRSEMERASAFSFLHFLFMLKTTVTARSLSKQGKSLGPATLPGYPYKKRPEIIEQSFQVQIKSQKKRNPDKKINFTFAVMNALKWPLLVNILLHSLALSLKIVMAWVAKNLLENLSDVNAPASDSFIWAGILSTNLLLSSYVEHHYLYQATLLPLHIRSGIISLIYTKITRLSVYSLNRISLGKLVNIVANDVNVFERTGVFFSTLVAGIYSLIGSAALLWIFFGPSCLVGIGYCILGFPLQQALAKLTNKPRDEKNAVTDERVKATNEVMDGIRLLKMYAWEQIFRDTIAKIRAREIGFLKKIANIESLSRGIAFSTQAVASFLIWMTYALTDHELSVSIVFPSFYLIGIIRLYSVFVFSLGLNFAVEAKLLMKRIQDVLEVPEIGDTHFKECMDAENSVEFKDFTAYWSKEEPKSVQTNGDDQPRTEKDKTKLITQENRPTLSDINLDIKKGSLNALIGKVGSGKSSFLLSFTGEMPRIEGSLRFGGSIAYVEQEPTIFAGTFRENILFGKTYEPEFYNQVVKACSLESDVKLFPNGDLSEIGEKGVNLSGGQKARLALARAVYADADIYLLDDPLSAVDAKVAKSLYHDVIMDQLKGKTVILATHQVHFVKDLENIIVMDDGKVIGSGCYEQLSKQNVDLDKIFSSEHKSCIGKKSLVPETQATSSVDVQSLTQASRADKEESEKDDEEEELKPDEDKGKLFINEDAYAGKVDLSTYGAYIRQMGSPALIPLLTLLYIGNELANVAFSRILGVWADGDLSRAEALGIMGGITVLILAFGIGKTMLLSQMLLKSARSFHDKMLDRILKNPVRFFDTNPVGRILNRFSNDLGVLDRFLPMTIMDVADYLFYICSLLITVAVINPIILAPVAVAAIMMVILLNLFYQSLKQTRNYELGSRSPLYSLFSSSLTGIIIIRSYKQTDNFVQKFRALLHNNTKGSIAFCSVSRLFGFSVDLIYNLSAVASIFIVTATKNSNPGLSGLSISFILSVSSIIQVALRQTVQSNVLMASVGRVKAYCETSTEAALALPRDKEVKKAGWPQEGKIEMNKVYMKYRPTTDHVIRDLTLSAQPGEKIGCIGRTGAGKSSIIQILFRMVEIDRAAENPDQSFVKIDGVDSQTLGLHMLRNNISIIPQTPFVFTGTVKRNLDPIGQFTDEQLWKVLEDVNLKAHVEKLEKQLYTDMTNASSVFSVGQKQLICLARAILKKSKLLVLDEATANVDMETDNFIQKKIMEKFSDSTVFTIAHRLSTIANYDRVLVLDKGKKVEFDEPYKLLVEKVGDDEISNQSGHFASMVLNTGPRASKQIFKTAKDKFFEKDKNAQASENWAKKV